MTNHQNNIDIRRLRGVLLQIAQLAREASMTGSLDKGARSAGQQFNRILQIVEQKGIDPGGLFEPMPEEASFDQIGVAAAQLVGFLEVDSQAAAAVASHGAHPPLLEELVLRALEVAVASHGAHPPHPSHHGHGGGSNVVTDMSQFKDLEQLKGLGQMIREQLPEWIKREVEAKMSTVHGHIAEAEVAARHAEAQARHAEAQARAAQTRVHSDQAGYGTQRLLENPGGDTQSEFRDRDMSGARFSDTNLAGAAFSDVSFDNVEFNDVNFSNVTFHDTNFANASFHDLNFSNTQFHDVCFDDAQFHGSSFHNVEISGGNISGMKINGITVEDLLRRYEQA